MNGSAVRARMNMHRSGYARGVKRLLFSLRDWEAAIASAGTGDAPANLNASNRSKLVQSVADFFLDHDVHVTGRRFMLVHDMLADTKSELGKRYLARIKSGLDINDAWLETLENDVAKQQSAELDKLMAEFDSQLAHFRTNTRTAREVTENYNGQIESEISEVAADPTELAALAAKLLQHSRDLAATMKHNEEDTEKLQQRLAKAKAEAQTDQLTGLPNRRAFEDQFILQCDLARVSKRPLCLAFCDIDNFKQVNDRHGHDTGDRVLRKISEILAALSQQGSFVSRHGGEEFVVLFPNTDLAEAVDKLDRAREEISSKELRNRDDGSLIGRISFSAGIADITQFENPRDGLKAADAALYRAKEQGKNQVIQA